MQNLITQFGASNPAGATGLVTTKALIPMNNFSGLLQMTNNKQGGGNQSPFDKGNPDEKIAWAKAFVKEGNHRTSMVILLSN